MDIKEDYLQVIKRSVRELRAYSLSPVRANTKLNQNENPYGMPSAIVGETLRRMSRKEWARYPTFVPQSLREKLATFNDWTADGIVVGNGSNELIQSLLMVTIEKGKRLFISEPTFALYRQIATVLGGDVLSVPLKNDLTFDIDALADRIKRWQPEVTILCSPNNPTGCRIELEELERLLKTALGLIVIDEAYFEFSKHTVAPLLREYTNLAVFRTFSKAMAMAALRVGYVMCSPSLAREISKAVLPYNLNAFSQTAAEVAIELYDESLSPLVDRIIKERDRLYDELQKINGLTPVPSHANFMVARSRRTEPKEVFRALVERDVLVRDVSGYPMLQDHFRVSVGKRKENDILLATLREIFQGENVDGRTDAN
jgi:histidinol-phosphate aminotransferase